MLIILTVPLLILSAQIAFGDDLMKVSGCFADSCPDDDSVDKSFLSDWNTSISANWNSSKEKGHSHHNVSDFSGGFFVNFGGNLNFLGSLFDKKKDEHANKKLYPLHGLKGGHQHKKLFCKAGYPCEEDDSQSEDSDDRPVPSRKSGGHHASYPEWESDEVENEDCNGKSDNPSCKFGMLQKPKLAHVGHIPRALPDKSQLKEKNSKYQLFTEKVKGETHQLKTPYNVYTKTITYNKTPRSHYIDYFPGWVKKQHSPNAVNFKPFNLRYNHPCHVLEDGTHVDSDNCEDIDMMGGNKMNANLAPYYWPPSFQNKPQTTKIKPTIGDLIDDDYLLGNTLTDDSYQEISFDDTYLYESSDNEA